MPAATEATPISRTWTGASGLAGRGHSGGFTLLEVIVIVLIIAVAAGVVLPAVNAGARQREVRRTLQHFVSAVRRASAIAILRRQPVELRVWQEEGRYAVVTRDRKTDHADDEEDSGGLRGLIGSDDEEAAEGESTEAEFELPELATFGEISGGRFLAEDLDGGAYHAEDVVLFDFFPTGSSSGGRVEFLFELPRSEQKYTVIIDPLVSSIDMEEDE